MPQITAAPLRQEDRPGWSLLWAGYQAFYGIELGDTVTDVLWARLLDPGGAIRGLGASVDGRLVGIAHWLTRWSTWSTEYSAYLQDLFVDPGCRQSGVGRALLDRVNQDALASGSKAVDWLTHETNSPARRLYDRVATNTGFIHYRMPTRR